MALYKISSSRVNNIEANQYAGSVVEQGLIWYDPEDGLLRLYNGNVGGYIINSGGGSSGNPIAIDYNGNIVTSNVSTINFTGNGVNVSGNGANVTVNISQPPSNLIELGNSNVRVWPDGNVSISIRGNANAAVFSNAVAVFDNLIVTGLETVDNLNANVISATGNVTAAYFIGDGSQLTGISGAYSNANVATYLASGNNTSNKKKFTPINSYKSSGNLVYNKEFLDQIASRSNA
jgi:hypothetical protein